MAKHWALIFLMAYLIVLTVFSLVKLEKLPPLGSSFDDKIFHFISHAVLTGLCYNFFVKTKVSQPILFSAFMPVIYGIFIEWLQGIGSSLRASDGYDIIANILGMIFVIIIISIYKNVKLK